MSLLGTVQAQKKLQGPKVSQFILSLGCILGIPMSLKPCTVVQSSVIRTHMVRDKALYPEQVSVLFIAVFPEPSIMPGT